MVTLKAAEKNAKTKHKQKPWTKTGNNSSGPKLRAVKTNG